MGINKEEAQKKIQDSKETEFEVFEGEEHKKFLDNFKETVIAPKIKEVHDKYDVDIKEVTGIDREGNEKSYNYLKRAGGVLKEKADKVTEFETKVTELEGKIKSGSGDEQLKTKLEQAESDLTNAKKLFTDEKETWKKEKLSLETSHARSGMSNILDRALVGIKFKDGMTEDIVKMVVDAKKDKLLESAHIVEGKMIFKDAEGNTLINTDKGYNPFTPEEMLRSELNDIIDEGRKIPGTGVVPKIEKNKDGKKTVNYVPADSVKTKDDLTLDLAEKGFVQGTPEHAVAWAEHSDKYQNPSM